VSNTVAIQKIVFFFRDSKLDVIGDSRESSAGLSYPSRLGDLGERRGLPQWGLEQSPSRERFLDVFMQTYAILVILRALVHFGS